MREDLAQPMARGSAYARCAGADRAQSAAGVVSVSAHGERRRLCATQRPPIDEPSRASKNASGEQACQRTFRLLEFGKRPLFDHTPVVEHDNPVELAREVGATERPDDGASLCPP